MSDGAAESITGAGSTASDAAAQQSGAAAPKTRAPVDPEKRDRMAKRAAVKRITRQLDAAKDDGELWARIDALAAKRGKTIAKPEATQAAAPDPLDQRKGPEWPTEREIQAAKPTANVLLAQLQLRAQGTRYEEPAKLACSPSNGEPAQLMEPLAACIAKYASDMKDMTPGGALALTALMLFGPTLAAHCAEAARAWYESREAAAVHALPAPAQEKPTEKKGKAA